MGASQKWHAAALQPHPRVTLKDSGNAKILPILSIGDKSHCLLYMDNNVKIYTDYWQWQIPSLADQEPGKRKIGKLGSNWSGIEA